MNAVRQPATIDDLNARDRAQVEEVAAMTREIHEHLAHVEKIAAKRKARMARLRSRGVTLRILSKATGLSFQAIQKALLTDEQKASARSRASARASE